MCDVERLIRTANPVSDRRANQRWAKPPPATRAFVKLPVKLCRIGRTRLIIGFRPPKPSTGWLRLSGIIAHWSPQLAEVVCD
jgi:hypothetical protein